MNNKTREKLADFAGLDTWSSFHPLDMQRFNDFIIEAYKNGDLGISQEDFLAAFSNKNLEEVAIKFYGKYQDGIELLKRQ